MKEYISMTANTCKEKYCNHNQSENLEQEKKT